jgi:hypothetical protein
LADLVGLDKPEQWFEEFVLDTVTVSVRGAYSGETSCVIYGSPDYDKETPATIRDLLKCSGVRQILYNPKEGFTSNKPILFRVTKPVFPVTGSSNDYVNKWLPFKGNSNTVWVIGTAAMDLLGETSTLHLLFECAVRFRGFA